jgi:hypothetical protein
MRELQKPAHLEGLLIRRECVIDRDRFAGSTKGRSTHCGIIDPHRLPRGTLLLCYRCQAKPWERIGE